MDAVAAGATSEDAAAAAYRAVGGLAVDRLAGFWIRVLAFIMDYVIITFVGFMVGFAVTLLSYFMPVNKVTEFVFNLLRLVVSWVIWVGYLSFLWSTGGQMIGMMLTKLRVIKGDGAPLTLWLAIGRSLALILSFAVLIGVVMVAFTKRRQGLHDLLCDTLVVHDG